jgi:glycine cleavage system regulatory protein
MARTVTICQPLGVLLDLINAIVVYMSMIVWISGNVDMLNFHWSRADNPGIVHTITSALAKAGLSIDRLENGSRNYPHGGSVLFKMRGFAIALAPLPKTFDIVKIKAALVEWDDSLNCDVSMDDTVDVRY